MKILAIHTGNNPNQSIHQVDVWRTWRPLRELKKHVDWQIDERPVIMKFIGDWKDKKDFTEAELQKTYDDLKQYDIIWGSYTAFMHAMVYSLCKMLQEKEGVKIVMDNDDNMFSVSPYNVGWWQNTSHEKTYETQVMLRDVNYMTTTNQYLADVLMSRRTGDKLIKVVPNFISKDYKSPKPNNERVVIGYFGGASHYGDLHDTEMLGALEKVMHEHKDVVFKSVGMPFEHYLPRARSEFIGGVRGHAWVKELFPTLQFDIALGPITHNQFNLCKSDIKWQESAMMGAAFIGSNVRPYSETVRDGVDGLIVNNTSVDWYNAIKKLVEDKVLRQKLADNARARVESDFLIENNWTVLKKALEEIHES